MPEPTLPVEAGRGGFVVTALLAGDELPPPRKPPPPPLSVGVGVGVVTLDLVEEMADEEPLRVLPALPPLSPSVSVGVEVPEALLEVPLDVVESVNAELSPCPLP